MRPFFTYYGGKWSIAERYEDPRYDVIIEPFAGSAGYSVRRNARYVVLADLHEKVIATWRYLICAQPEEIRRLPLLEIGQPVTDLSICQEAQWLIGWWTNKGTTDPCVRLSAWVTTGPRPEQFWGERIRERIASQVSQIKHWRALHVGYQDLPDFEGTWFVDPPYSSRVGRRYPHNRIDYGHLAEWCKSRSGQVIACDQAGADWLPFEYLTHGKATHSPRKSGHFTAEVAWQR